MHRPPAATSPSNLPTAIRRHRQQRTQRWVASLLCALLLSLLPVGSVAAAPPPTTTTLNVTALGEQGWTLINYDTGDATFVYGPSPAPLGNGSMRLTTGPGAFGLAIVSSHAHDLTPLGDIDVLSYQTYNVASGGCQTPALWLEIDTDGNETSDDALFFYPCEQTGGGLSSAAPAQPTPTTGIWQTWNVASGALWAQAEDFATSQRYTLATYLAAYPNARISTSGISLVVGGLNHTWPNTDSRVDALAITINNATTIYNFDAPPDTGAPVVTSISASPNPAVAPATVTVSATLIDGNQLRSAVYTTGSGAPRSLQPLDGVWDEAVEEVQFSLTNLAARTHTICVRGTDIAGNTGANTCVSVVVNAPAPTDTTPPQLSNLQVEQQPLRIGQSTLLSVTVDDSSTGGSQIAAAQYRIDGGSWQALLPGDGQWNAVSESAQKIISFASAGEYTVCVRARDRANNQTPEQCLTVTVINPASTVSGNGQFTSPRNAISSAPAHTGRATFTLQARYASSQATAPTGTFTLQLTGSAFSFQSTSLTSLITTSGGVGELRGTGKLNGQTGYNFRVSFDDSGTGTSDRIRIRVWHSATNALVYDSQPGQPATNAPTVKLASGNLSVTP